MRDEGYAIITLLYKSWTALLRCCLRDSRRVFARHFLRSGSSMNEFPAAVTSADALQAHVLEKNQDGQVVLNVVDGCVSNAAELLNALYASLRLEPLRIVMSGEKSGERA